MKRLLALVLVFVMAVTVLLTGCNKTTSQDAAKPTSKPSDSSGVTNTPGEKGPVNPAGQFPIVDEPLTLTFFKEGVLTDEQLSDLDQNGVLNYIFEKTNIKLDFVWLNAAEGKQKLILSFAAGDYPDGALLDWSTLLTQSDLMQYGMKENILLPLNNLIDTYGLEIKQIFNMRPTYRSFITAPDGEIYGLPRFTECYHCMSYPKLWFNYTWMEKLGFDEPQTTEELYEVLKAFKTQDPNGNGQDDEIVLTGGIEYSMALEYYLMNSFIDTPATSTNGNPRPFLSWIDNQVTFVADKAEYKMGLEWMKKLYDEGLIDPANFTQKADGLAQQCRSEIPTVGGYTTDHLAMGIDYANKEFAAMYKALPPVKGPTGARFQPYQDMSPFQFQFAIFDNCENPEAAFRLADFFLAEEFLPIGHYGMEGINWKAPDDPNAKNIMGGPLKWVPIRLPKDASEEEIKKQSLNSMWIPLLGDLIERRAMWSPAATPETLLENYETYLDYETQKTEKYWPEVTLPRSLFMEAAIAEEFNELKLNINAHVLKNTSMFITGARSLDEWDIYVKELEQFGLERYIEIYSEAYKEFKSK